MLCAAIMIVGSMWHNRVIRRAHRAEDHADRPNQGPASRVPTAVAALFFAASLMTARGGSEAVSSSDPGRASPEKLPPALSGYEPLPGSQSPDGTGSVLFPRKEDLVAMERKDKARLVLVENSPPRVVCDLPRGASLLTIGHGSCAFAWIPDSSAFLMVQGMKWGPDRVYLCELRKGNPPALTELVAKVAKVVRPAFKASGAPRFNDSFDFIFDVVDPTSPTSGWQFTRDGDVSIDTKCTNDPKELDEKKMWTVHWQGIWKRREQRLVKVNVRPASGQ